MRLVLRGAHGQPRTDAVAGGEHEEDGGDDAQPEGQGDGVRPRDRGVDDDADQYRYRYLTQLVDRQEHGSGAQRSSMGAHTVAE